MLYARHSIPSLPLKEILTNLSIYRDKYTEPPANLPPTLVRAREEV